MMTYSRSTSLKKPPSLVENRENMSQPLGYYERKTPENRQKILKTILPLVLTSYFSETLDFRVSKFLGGDCDFAQARLQKPPKTPERRFADA